MQQEEHTERIIYLISQAASGTISASELQELEEWKSSSPANSLLYGQLLDSDYRKKQLRNWDDQITEQQLVKLNARMDGYQRRNRFKYGIAAAASVLLALGLLFFFHQPSKTLTPEQTLAIAAQIQPGGNRATLTLANGTVIDLEQAGNGAIAEQAGVQISKTADGQLSYEAATSTSPSSSQYNTIATPKGGQFEVRLPDGTMVTLNAASSLTYPASFQTGKERSIELKGEAYFKVTHNKAQPFIVKTATQEIEVLGTQFNVNSYADENRTVTTLEEGSVKVSTTDQQKMIRPGQQTVVSTGKLQVQEADMQLALAWTNNQFRFKDAAIPEILKQAARWYNLEVIYEGTPPPDLLTGAISRKSNLDVLLRILQESSISFSIEKSDQGQKLTIHANRNK